MGSSLPARSNLSRVPPTRTNHHHPPDGRMRCLFRATPARDQALAAKKNRSLTVAALMRHAVRTHPLKHRRSVELAVVSSGVLRLAVAVVGLAVATASAYTAPSVAGLGFEIGRLDADKVAARQPRLFCTSEEIRQARQRVQEDPAARTTRDRLIETADRHKALDIRPLDESWWDAVKDKPWGETYPDVFLHTMKEPLAYGLAAAESAQAWQLTDREEYADRAVAALMNLTPYTFQAEHYDVGLNFSIWGLHALRAYEIIYPRLTAGQRREVDDFMTRLAWAVARNHVYWIEHNVGGGLNNHLAWHSLTLGLLGLFYDRPEMVEVCMQGPRGMMPMLEEGLLDDGLWCESSLVYHFTAVVPMIILGDCQRRMGRQPSMLHLTGANGRTLKQAFDAMLNVIFPDTMIPPIGDAYGARTHLWQMPVYEYAWAAWGDPHYAWLLAQNPERRIESLFSPPLPAAPPVPPVGTLLRPEHGYAFLRSHRDAEYWNTDAWCAFLTYDRSSVHANADKLSLMLFGQGTLLLPDVEGKATVPHAFSSRIQSELNRGGLSQNTVMIDGRDQRCGPEMLRLVEFRDLPDEKRVTAADDKGLLYEGVRQMRTVAMTPDYVLDVFQVDAGGTERQADWIIHALDEQAVTPPEGNPHLARCSPFALPDTGAWSWLRNARSYVPDEDIRMAWRGERARLRLHMLNPSAERVILCGYPASDEPDSGEIPMVIVRCREPRAVFAAIWLIGDRPTQVEFRTLPPRDGCLAYEVIADGHARQHLVPGL